MKHLTLAQIEEHLLTLRSPDYETRKVGFDALKNVPREALSEAWKAARRVQVRGGELDCFERVEVFLDAPLQLDRAIVTVISAGFETYLHTLLRSLERVGSRVPVIVFCVGQAYELLANWTGITRIRCEAHERLDASIKGCVYSCARWVKAKTILAIESDMVAAGDLESLWKFFEEGVRLETMAGCRPACFPSLINSLQWVLDDERGEPTPLPWLSQEKFVFNGGLLIGDFAAWNRLDERLSDLGPYSQIFLDGAMRSTYGEEMLMIHAVNHLENLIELHPGWNVQFYDNKRAHWMDTHPAVEGKPQYFCRGHAAKVLHFMSGSRRGAEGVMHDILAEMEGGQINAPSLVPALWRQCRECRLVSGVEALFQPGTTAIEKSRSGHYSALCRECFGQRTRIYQ